MRTLVKSRLYKAGYKLIIEEISGDEAGGGPSFIVTHAETLDGTYIGNAKVAHYLIVRRGIKPEKAAPEHNVCSIGFSEKDQKWYGWSHRAIYGFGIGDIVKDGDCAASEGIIEEYLKDHPEERTALPVGFTAHTLDDAKKIAIAFAESVS